MMTPYLPYIFGSASFFGGVYLFLYYFRIYIPKHKTEENKLRYEKSLEKFGKFGKAASIILIINGGYDLLMHDTERYMIKRHAISSEWTTEDRNQLNNDCIIGAGKAGEKYPELIKEYCECSTIKIMNAFTRDQYIENARMQEEERLKILQPVFQGCLDEFKTKIDSVKKQSL